jgi:hypothetical protein
MSTRKSGDKGNKNPARTQLNHGLETDSDLEMAPFGARTIGKSGVIH